MRFIIMDARYSLPTELTEAPGGEIEPCSIPSMWSKVQGLRVHYKCLGNGPPVLLIHGSATDWREWEENVLPLAQGLRIHAIDMPGYGLSEPLGRPLTLRWAVPFVHDFMASVGMHRPHLMGHSLGGMVALALALENPEKVNRLCLVDSAGLGEISASGRLWLYLARRIGGLRATTRIPKFVSCLYDRMLPQRMRELTSPTLIVWGGRDRYLPVRHAKKAHRAIRSSTLAIFPRSGHAPQREEPREFNRLVHRFFSDTDAVASPPN